MLILGPFDKERRPTQGFMRSTGRMTKVKRCTAEGRKHFLEVFAAIYRGE
jgi:hypothetical protein